MRQFKESLAYRTTLRTLTAAVVLAIGAVAAHADYDSNDTDYDASFIHDTSLSHVGYFLTDTLIPLDDLNMNNFGTSDPLPTGGGSETVTTTLDWSAIINGLAVHGTGSMSTLVTDMGGGVYDQQVTAMDLTSSDGLDGLRLNGTQQVGQETITPEGGGVFHITSFFDVFTELTIDGGSTWIPATSGSENGQIRLSPSGSPEPITMGLAAVGLGIAARRRRRP